MSPRSAPSSQPRRPADKPVRTTRSTGSASRSRTGRGRLDRFAGSHWALLPTFLLALAMRLIHLDQMRGYEDFRIQVLDDSWTCDLASRFLVGTVDAVRPFDGDPGAAVLVSGLTRFLGNRPDLVLAALAVIGAFGATVIQLLGVRVLGGAAGFFCGLIAAGYRPAIHHGGHLLDAAFLPILAAMALWLAACLVVARRPVAEILLGMVAGFATTMLAMVQAPLVVLSPLILVLLMFDQKMKRGQKIRRGASFAAGSLLMLVGLSTLQTPAGGPKLLLPPSFGREFHLANREANRPGFRLPPLFAPADPAGLAAAYRVEGARVSGLPEGDALAIDQAWFDLAAREAAENPWGFLHGWSWRAVRLVHAQETPGPFVLSFESGRSWILRLPFPGWGLLFPLAVIGLLSARRESKKPAPGLVVGWFLAVLLAASPFAVTSRVRMAAEPALIVLAVLGAMSIAPMIRKRDGRALAVAALTAGIVGLLIRLPIGGSGAAPFHRILVGAYLDRGAVRAAEDHRMEADRLADPARKRLGQSR